MSTFVNLSALTGGYSQKTPDCFEFKSSQSGDINSKARAFQNPKRLGFRQFTAAFYLPDVQQSGDGLPFFIVGHADSSVKCAVFARFSRLRARSVTWLLINESTVPICV